MAETKSKVKTQKAKTPAKKAAAPKAVKAPKKTKEVKETKVAEVSTKIVQFAVGRRKRAVARVRMYEGNGEIIINEKPAEEYANSKALMVELLRPLEVSGVREGHRFTAKVLGGGIAGQIEAVKHGIARCIAKINDDMKVTMKQGGFLTRDPREKERKKVYHVRARKSPQYSKR